MLLLCLEGRCIQWSKLDFYFLARAYVINALLSMLWEYLKKLGMECLILAMVADFVGMERTEEALIMFKDVQKFSWSPLFVVIC